MSAAGQTQFLPGYRGVIRDISEAGGSLCQLHEIVDEYGLARLIEALDAGMVVYQAGDVMFVSAGDFRIYNELLDRIEAGDDLDDDVDDGEDVDAAEPMAADG